MVNPIREISSQRLVWTKYRARCVGMDSIQLCFIYTPGWSQVHASLAVYHWVEDEEEKPCCYSTLASDFLSAGTETQHGWICRPAV